MIRRMEQLISGKWDADQSELFVSPEEINVSAPAGVPYRDSFQVRSGDRTEVRGLVSVDNPRIHLDVSRFSGRVSEIPWEVSLRGLKKGEKVEANLTLITSLGEKSCPICVEVQEEEASSFPAAIQNLDDFASLARRSYAEAYRLFGKEGFKELLENESPRIRCLYAALSRSPLSYQRMEEFLVASGKKEAVHLEQDQRQVALYQLKESVKNVLRLTRNTWGHLSIRIETEGDFIEIPRRQLTDEDFVGSVCDLEYIIHAEKIINGRYFGRIILKSADQTLTLDLIVSRGYEVPRNARRILKRDRLRLARLLLDRNLGRLSDGEFARKSRLFITAMHDLGAGSCALTLYEAYIDLVSRDLTGMKKRLTSLKDHDFSEEDTEVRGAFLYLAGKAGLVGPEEIDIRKKLEDWQRRERESFILLYMLMDSDDELERMPVRRFVLWEELYDCGSRNPLMYAEALKLLREDPRLLKRLNAFTRSLLAYGAREHLLTEELALRGAALSENEKTFTRRMYELLARAYEDYPSRNLLEAICRLIMKGNPRSRKYFHWYEAAIENDVRLTRLYEYYIETIPATYQERFPTPIRKYFLMNSSIGNRQLAFIYANIVRNRHRDEAAYQDYLPKMQSFARRLLKHGAINEDLAVLYQAFRPSPEETELRRALTGLMFTNHIVCDDERIRAVIVRHEALAEELVCPLNHGEAYVPVYTDEAVILFQDEVGRRFASGISYSRQILMETESLATSCLPEDVTETGLLLYLCSRLETITFENLPLCRQFAQNRAFTAEKRAQMSRQLLSFYGQHAGDERIGEILSQLDAGDFPETDRRELAGILIRAGHFRKAYKLILKYGSEGLGIADLLRLVSALIDELEGEKDEDVLALAVRLYRQNKYNDRVLRYLTAYFSGPLEAMVDIRRHVRAFCLESYELDERILLQAMFVRQPLKDEGRILRAYRREGGRLKVIRAYLTFESNDCLMNDRVPDDVVTSFLARAWDEKTPLDSVCRLALLYRYASQTRLSPQEEERVDALLEEMIRRGIRLDFFRYLPKTAIAGYGILDRTFIEQKAAPEDQVILHYRLSQDDGENGDGSWRSEPMTMVYRGIFSREFLLFYGERLSYYITIEHNGGIRTLPVQSCRQEQTDDRGNSRYQLINQMLKARRSGYKKDLTDKIRQYQRAVHLTETLFSLDENEKGEGGLM